jgi:hypothetical protein
MKQKLLTIEVPKGDETFTIYSININGHEICLSSNLILKFGQSLYIESNPEDHKVTLSYTTNEEQIKL